MDWYETGWGCCEYGVKYDSTLGYWEDRQPLDRIIDINTFVCSVDSSCYSKDKNHVYWFVDNVDGGWRRLVKNADAKTFRGLSNYCLWGIDKNYVYFKCDNLKGLNLKKIQLLKKDSLDKKPLYIKDDKLVFYEYRKVEKADAKTFKVVEQTATRNYDAFDKYRKYSSGEPKN